MEFLCKACNDLVSLSSGSGSPSVSLVGAEAAVKLVLWSAKLIRTLPEVVVVSKSTSVYSLRDPGLP